MVPLPAWMLCSLVMRGSAYYQADRTTRAAAKARQEMYMSLRAMFDSYDDDGSGELNQHEMVAFMQKAPRRLSHLGSQPRLDAGVLQAQGAGREGGCAPG